MSKDLLRPEAVARARERGHRIADTALDSLGRRGPRYILRVVAGHRTAFYPVAEFDAWCDAVGFRQRGRPHGSTKRKRIASKEEGSDALA